MIGRQEILEFAREVSLNPNVVEKDYVLGWMLAGIAYHPHTRDTWLFKGGTCLKKCYFETYRFSEDLDFTLLDGSHVDEAFLGQIFAEITEWIYGESGIELPENARVFEVYANPRGNKSAQGRVGYRGPMQRQTDLPRVRFDLTNDERVVKEGVRRRAHHPYSDEPEGGIHVLAYSFEEVFAEKFRALAERQRPRDLYDVVHLYRHETGADRVVVRDVLTAKCEFKGIAIPTFETIRSSPQHDELRADWQQMLAHQLPELPPFDSFWDELPSVFAWLEKEPEGVRPPVMGPGRFEIDPAWRAPAMAISWRAQGIGAPLEIIRFAAANRLCVELDYQDEEGRRGTRVIEPYSLRRTKAGDLLLYAVRSQDGHDRSYRVDRILGARATQQTFKPRYAVELSMAMPLVAPEITRARQLVTPYSFRVAPKPRAVSRRTAHGLSGFGQPKYVFQCPYCRKKFERQQYDSALNPHKTKDGYPCPSRTGYYVTTRY
jgi:predicted nucleotidyltransferase component of viral defense system